MTGMFSVARCPDEGDVGMAWGGNWEEMEDNSANKIVSNDGGVAVGIINARMKAPVTVQACNLSPIPVAKAYGQLAFRA